tara:strand:+ start:355 stop:1023 length:669 start_codon:yes stop_codon:yes gene_type:complete
MGPLLQLGFVTANIIRTLSWKTVQKRFPNVSKKLFNQIKQYKNKKNLKNAFDKSKPKKKKTVKKTETKKTETKTTTPKKKTVKTTIASGAGTLTQNTIKDIKNLAKLADKVTLGLGGKVVQGAIKRPVTTALGTYAGTKAVETGTKLFQNMNKKKTTDITNQVTGGDTTTGDTKTTTQVTGAGGTGINDFVAAHNSALDGGQQFFRFDGKMYAVGKTKMSDF